MTTFQKLLEIKEQKGAGYLVLIDPDKGTPQQLTDLAIKCEKEGVDGLLIGGSLLSNYGFDDTVKSIKEAVEIPVILFPGAAMQVSKYADAIFFMSLISGRNPQFLIGEQVQGAPLVKSVGLETIPMGYMLIESGTTTSAEFMSNTKPIPRSKPGIAVAHGLAGQYLGMQILYLEAGSGAKEPVPNKMITSVSHVVDLPLIAGGGILSPEIAAEKVKAGASFIVTGNVLEKDENHHLIGSFADAIHLTGDKKTIIGMS